MPEQESTTASCKSTKARSGLGNLFKSVKSVFRHSHPHSTTTRRSTQGSNIDPSSPDGPSNNLSTSKPFPTRGPSDQKSTFDGKDHTNSDGTNDQPPNVSYANQYGVKVTETEYPPEDPDAITPVPPRDSRVPNHGKGRRT